MDILGFLSRHIHKVILDYIKQSLFSTTPFKEILFKILGAVRAL